MIKLEDLKVGDRLKIESRDGSREIIWEIIRVGDFTEFYWTYDSCSHFLNRKRMKDRITPHLLSYAYDNFNVSYISQEEVFSL